MRAAWFHNSRQSSGGPLQSCLCYFDTGWQWGGHRGHERQCFTSESRSDLTWIKWRISQRWLPQPPAQWGNVNGGLVGEVRTAQSAAPACRFLTQGGLFTETPPTTTPPAPPQLASTTPSSRSTITQLHVHAVMQTDGERLFGASSSVLYNQEILTFLNATFWLYFLNEMLFDPRG